MENEILNKSICEELEGDLDVAEKPDLYCKSDMRREKHKFEEEFGKLKKYIGELQTTITEMEEFSGAKKNMFLQIQHGLYDASQKLRAIDTAVFTMDLYYPVLLPHLGSTLGQKVQTMRREAGKRDVVDKGTQAVLDAEEALAIAMGKRARTPTASPETAAIRPPPKKLKSRIERAKSETETKKKEETEPKLPKRSRNRRALPDAVLIKTADGCSYADVLRNLKQKVAPDELGVKVKGVRETRNGDVLIEIGATEEDRAKLTSAIKEAVGGQGNVRELVPLSEVEIKGIDPTIDAAEVNVALKKYFGEKMTGEIRVNMTKKPFRGCLRAFASMREDMAARLVRTGHVKIGWTSCAVRIKKEARRCYRCQGYGHLAADCDGPDRKACCWRCGSDKHRAAECNSTPLCFLCAAKEGSPRTDHLPGTGRCAVFKEATRKRRPRDAAR